MVTRVRDEPLPPASPRRPAAVGIEVATWLPEPVASVIVVLCDAVLACSLLCYPCVGVVLAWCRGDWLACCVRACGVYPPLHL